MIHIPPLRTRRLIVQLRELPIGDSLAVLATPEHLEQATVTQFLKRAVESAKGVEDPAQWTVQERTMATAHYLAAVSDDGPDFSLGAGRYSDYLDAATDTNVDLVPAGELGGDRWQLRQLTGFMVEAIERLHGEVPGFAGRLHWTMGAMAAQLVRENEALHAGEAGFDEWLLNRMRVLAGFPESDFVAMVAMFRKAREQLHHLFHMDFADTGIIFLPKGGAAVDLPPARFPADSCLSEFARRMVGRA